MVPCHVTCDDLCPLPQSVERAISLSGTSPEEVIRSATQSRASLREIHRRSLSALKASQDDRRSHSPALVSVRSRKSVLSEAELDEDGDMPFPPDETKGESIDSC